MRNFPEAEKIARRLKAMLPPQVQAAEEEEQPAVPPQVMAVLQQAQQEIQALQQQLQEAQSGMAAKQLDSQVKLQLAAMSAEEKRTLTQLQIESNERIALMGNENKAFLGELAGAIELIGKNVGVPVQLSAAVNDDLEADAEPAEEKPDPVMMLTQILGQMTAPKRKRMAIQAPSGQVYEGVIQDEDDGGVMQ
jgi:hypothetical protein